LGLVVVIIAIFLIRKSAKRRKNQSAEAV